MTKRTRSQLAANQARCADLLQKKIETFRRLLPTSDADPKLKADIRDMTDEVEAWLWNYRAGHQ